METSLIDLLGDDPGPAQSDGNAPPTRGNGKDDHGHHPAAESLSAGLIHESELADLLGITANRIRTLTRDGVIKRSGPARYAMRATVQAYCEHLRQHAARAGRPSETNVDIKAEQLRLKRAQADAQEAKNRQLSGELVAADAVSREWQSVLRDVRAAMLAVPSRYGATLPHLTAKDVVALDHEIRAALEGLADGHA